MLRTSLPGLLALLSVSQAGATLAISNLSPSGLYNNNGAFNAGFRFTVGSTAIQVTQLGFYDLFNGGTFGTYTNPAGNGDGLINSVTVAIYNSTGTTQLVSATVTNADSLVSDGGSQSLRLHDITPFTLSANTTYRIAAITPNGGDKFIYNSSSYSFASGITYNGGVYGFGTANPTNLEAGANGYFGPSFNFTAVPEPSSVAMGSAALLLLARRRRK